MKLFEYLILIFTCLTLTVNTNKYKTKVSNYKLIIYRIISYKTYKTLYYFFSMYLRITVDNKLTYELKIL